MKRAIICAALLLSLSGPSLTQAEASLPASTSSEPVAFYPNYMGPADPMDPRWDEVLSSPINLEKCAGLQILEWRPVPGRESTTGASPKAIHLLNQVCYLAMSNFDEFVRSRGRTPAAADPFAWFVCLMPGPAELGGNLKRNLNDESVRFYVRPKALPGTYYSGWTSHNRNKIFMRNDFFHEDGTMNEHVSVVFAHEIFHAMSKHYGIFLNVEDDERLAREFTDYIGMNE